jgi:hypothetical protein
MVAEIPDKSTVVCHRGICSLGSQRFWLFSIAIVALAGCGSNQIPIAGMVTLEGKPLTEGSISLEPVDGLGPTTGGKIVEGKYTLIGSAAPLPGKKTVRVSGAFKTGRRIPAGPPLPSGTMIDEIGVRVPDAYGTSSSLTCEVSRDGPKEIDFHLKLR